MSWLETLKNAPSGWSDILAGNAAFRDKFDLGLEGINRASIAYLSVVFALLALQLVVIGFVPPLQTVILALNYLAPMLALLAVTAGFGAVGVVSAPTADIAVPGLLMHAAMLVVNALLAFAGFALGGAVLGITGFLLYKLGRVAGAMSPQWSLGFAAINVAGLIAITLLLYAVSANIVAA